MVKPGDVVDMDFIVMEDGVEKSRDTVKVKILSEEEYQARKTEDDTPRL